jgi:hypothetical protein
VARFFSLRGSAAHALAFAALGFGLMLGAGVKDFFDGEEEFGKVAAGPFCETPNKRFNHWMIFTF